MEIGVLIPAFNERGSIGKVVSKLRRLGITKVLVIDDGSQDDTAEMSEKSGAKTIRHSKNLGKGACIREGLKYFYHKNVDGVVLMDADGQHNPDEITRFLNSAKDKTKKLIIGNRMKNNRNMPLIRWITNRVMSFIIFILCGQYIPDTQCGYRFIRKNLLHNINLVSCNYEIESEMILETTRKGERIYSVPITTIYRQEVSQINVIKDTLRFFRLIVRFLFTPAKN